MVRTLAGECTASLSWPWGVCGDRACPVAFNINEWGCWRRLGSQRVVRTLTGECTASLADHGVCVGLWRTGGDGTSRLFTVHRTGMLGRPMVIAPVVSEDCAKGLLHAWVNHQDGLLVWDRSGQRCVISPFIVYTNGLLTRQCCDWWILMAAPFLIVHLVCVWNIVDEMWRYFGDPAWQHHSADIAVCMKLRLGSDWLMISDDNAASGDIHCVHGVVVTERNGDRCFW